MENPLYFEKFRNTGYRRKNKKNEYLIFLMREGLKLKTAFLMCRVIIITHQPRKSTNYEMCCIYIFSHRIEKKS